jgi:hypothetical protein
VSPIAIIYDDNRGVWDYSSQRNVNVVAPFSPYIIRPSDDLRELLVVRGSIRVKGRTVFPVVQGRALGAQV